MPTGDVCGPLTRKLTLFRLTAEVLALGWKNVAKALGTRWVSVGGVEKSVLSVRNPLVVFAALFETLMRQAVGKIRFKLETLKSEGNKLYFSTKGFVVEKRHTSAHVAGW